MQNLFTDCQLCEVPGFHPPPGSITVHLNGVNNVNENSSEQLKYTEYKCNKKIIIIIQTNK